MQKFTNSTVNGALAGIYKNMGTFLYVRFFSAGHEVPAYSWRGVANVHADHIVQAALWDMMCNVEGHV